MDAFFDLDDLFPQLSPDTPSSPSSPRSASTCSPFSSCTTTADARPAVASTSSSSAPLSDADILAILVDAEHQGNNTAHGWCTIS